MKNDDIVNHPEVKRIVEENDGKTIHIHIQNTSESSQEEKLPTKKRSRFGCVLLGLFLFFCFFIGLPFIFNDNNKQPTPDDIQRKHAADIRVGVFSKIGLLINYNKDEGRYVINGEMWDKMTKDQKFKTVESLAFHKSNGDLNSQCSIVSHSGRKLASYSYFSGVKLID